MSEFFAMGGYAAFVWPSYLLTFAAVGLNIYFARRVHEQARAALRRRAQMDDAEAGGEAE